jgi:hypothetical protein
MLVGPVSAKKTPILNRATGPLKQIDSEMYRDYARNLARYESLDKDARDQEEAPKQQRIRLEDVTIEAAQEVFKDSPNGLLCLQDELSGWFGSMDRYNSNSGAKDRGFWLQAYNGGEYVVNRIKRGSFLIPNLSACVLGGIQPDKIREVAADGVDDGILQRPLPIVLRPATPDRDEVRDDINNEYCELIEQLSQIAPLGPLEFSPKAQEVRREMADKHLKMMNLDIIGKKLAAHIGKYDGIFGRLCVVFHCIENMRYERFQRIVTHAVFEKTARRVADFLHKFLFPHACCFYGDVLGMSDEHESLIKVAGFILANKLDKIDNRTIQRGNRHMRKMRKRDIEDVFDQLDAFGWITKVVDKNKITRGIVNPKVHELFKERGEMEAARAKEGREVVAEYIRGLKT